MLVICASCLTKFNLDDSRIPLEGAQVRCSRCKHVFYVVPPPETRKEIIDGFQDFAKFHKGLIKQDKQETGISSVETETVFTESLPEEKEAVEEEIEIEEEGIEEEGIEEEALGEEEITEEDDGVEREEEDKKIGIEKRWEFEKEIDDKVDRLVVDESKKEAEVEAFLFSEKASKEEKKEWTAPGKSEGGPAPERREEWAPPGKEEELPSPEKPERFTPAEQARGERKENKFRKGKSPLRVEKKGPPRLLLFLFVLVILLVGVFYLWTELIPGGRLSAYIEAPVKKLSEIWNQILGTEEESLIVGDFRRDEEKIEDVPLLIIEGRVKNQSRFTKKYVKIKVTLFDQDNLQVDEKEVICGRIIPREDLMKQPLDFFNGEMLINPETDQEKITPPGKSVPFMVIFKDPPSQAKFKYEILESPNL
jgi:predicted Zn finger-like uncharacterized protein